ncbi:MAG TPA: T6SS effector amidase Tae4 family protein [Telluria sp.]
MTRPSFQTVWAAAQRIVAQANQSEKVARIIGGAVAKNINLTPPHGWTNTCALRLSYVLNYSGVQIPRISGKTVSGADKRSYFYRVKDVIDFLNHRWGKPDLIIPFPHSQQTGLAQPH